MRETLAIHVEDALEKLLEVELANMDWECTGVSDVVEEFTAVDHLLDDVSDSLSGSILLQKSRFFLECVQLHDVQVVQLIAGFDLFLEELEGALTEVRVLQVKHLDGILSAIDGASLEDFSAEALSEFSI